MDACLKNTQPISATPIARKIVLSGQVQGVGFRPFIYRLASEHQLSGWVRNCVGTVEIFAQGQPLALEKFLSDIFKKKPPLAAPKLVTDKKTTVGEYAVFTILRSQQQAGAHISVPTDLYLCDDCLAELNQPSERRYHYPFINCTQCGPRYTLIRRLPYDRANTTMAEFELCPDCLAEYEDPANRRFHAEPVACPVCGPALSFHMADVQVDDNDVAIKKTVELIRDGKIVAVKGIGGYHLVCDASNTAAVAALRKNKPRPDKPLAVMFPAPAEKLFAVAETYVCLSEMDKSFLRQPARPILLVKKNPHSALSQLIAPALNEVGVMLPYSPLHHLLLNDFAAPLVVTSANISGEPVLIENSDVEKRLSHVADACLHHNRPIQRPADDPVYRTIANRARPIRLGRGTTPTELILPFELQQPVLAVGAHMKNTITLAWKNHAVMSPHIGEMDSVRSLEVFENMITDLQALYGITAQQLICDAHPGYTTTRWAHKHALPVQEVLHHHAHAAAAYFECDSDEAIIAFAWDGVGYGEDGTLWGGETFHGKPGTWQRVASLKPFYLPGGDKAGRQPWRSAAAVCWQADLNDEQIPQSELPLYAILQQAWQQRINAPQTTSIGRLFDAAAALTGVRTVASFEGQGPMEFEALCESSILPIDEYVLLTIEAGSATNLREINWQPLIESMLDSTASVSERAVIFHHSLAHCLLQMAQQIRDDFGTKKVSFCGGVFQNRVLTEKAMALLTAAGFEVCLPELIPVNDAGVSFGQIMEYGYKVNAQT